MIILSDKEYNELIAISTMNGYNNGYRDGVKDAIDNIWSDMRERTEKIIRSNPPEFLAKHMNVLVPDCNDCMYLNYTEEEEQLHGLNHHKKEHRCKCYNKTVRHGTNFRNHDSYIHPCNECQEDNFVNYIKCDQKGELYV